MARVVAPDLVGHGGWIGTSEPLELRRLRGKVVVLHFFAFGSIESQRVEASLAEVSRRWPDSVAVIGVHSPKFPYEGRHRNVETAVARLGITHPVLDDPDMIVWQQYGVKGWPTQVVIDARGVVCGMAVGADSRPLLLQVVADAVAEGERRGHIDTEPLPTVTTARPFSDLAYPGKVASNRHGRIAIADTGNDRVVVATLGEHTSSPVARITHLISGLKAPQGVRLYGSELFICDAGNDRVMRIDLAARPGPEEPIVPDPAGIIRLHARAVDVLTAELSAPWDLIIDVDRSLVVAEAGRHRLWRLPLDGSSPGVIAGTGFEDLKDGRGASAELAQPSGMARVLGAIAFVDAESSSLRLLTDKGKVATLIGEGLFDWGMVDGGRRRARMQHPQGITASLSGDVLYIADTFNSVLREWDRRTMTTLRSDGLSEPGGLDMMEDGRLVVADTGNSRIVFVDPVQGTVTPLRFETARLPSVVPRVAPGQPLEVTEGRAFDVRFAVDIGGFWLNTDAEVPARITVDAQPPWLLDTGPRLWRHGNEDGRLKLHAGSVGTGWLTVTVSAEVRGDGVQTVRQSVTRHPLTVRDFPRALEPGDVARLELEGPIDTSPDSPPA